MQYARDLHPANTPTLQIDIAAGLGAFVRLLCSYDAQVAGHRSCKEFPVLLSAEAIQPDPGDEA